MKRWTFALALAVGAGCGGENAPDSGVAKVRVDATTELDPSKLGIASFLRAGTHRAWKPEAAVHDSQGPHGTVRTYFSEKYLAARRADRYPMPVGSVAVKELYAGDGATVDGYAVAVKTSSGAEAATWTWWEGFLTDLDAPKYSGVAVGTCEGCHVGGANKDRSLTASVPE